MLASHFTQGVQEVFPVFALVGCNLSTSTTDIRVDIKCLPQTIDAVVPRASPNVQQHAHVRLQHTGQSNYA